MTQDKEDYLRARIPGRSLITRRGSCNVAGRKGCRENDTAKVPIRNGCNVIGRDGTVQLLYRRGDVVMPQISSNNNNVQKGDGGQTAFIIMEGFDIRREDSGRNMRDSIPWYYGTMA